MDAKKRKAIEAAGWKVGDAADFLQMSTEEKIENTEGTEGTEGKGEVLKALCSLLCPCFKKISSNPTKKGPAKSCSQDLFN